jgi:multidrug efflux pump
MQNVPTLPIAAAGLGTLAQPVNGGFQWIFLKEPKERKSGLTQDRSSRNW